MMSKSSSTTSIAFIALMISAFIICSSLSGVEGRLGSSLHLRKLDEDYDFDSNNGVGQGERRLIVPESIYDTFIYDDDNTTDIEDYYYGKSEYDDGNSTDIYDDDFDGSKESYEDYYYETSEDDVANVDVNPFDDSNNNGAGRKLVDEYVTDSTDIYDDDNLNDIVYDDDNSTGYDFEEEADDYDIYNGENTTGYDFEEAADDYDTYDDDNSTGYDFEEEADDYEYYDDSEGSIEILSNMDSDKDEIDENNPTNLIEVPILEEEFPEDLTEEYYEEENNNEILLGN